jgi:glycosyltransferase involved in cell wall biosynthesis
MKIALIHYSAPPVVGGVETVIAYQAAQLARAGHQVRILAGRGETWNACIPVEILVRIDARYPQNLKYKTGLDAGQVPEGFAAYVQQVQSDLERALSGVDMVIAHNVASLNKNLALTAALHNLCESGALRRLVLWHHDLAWTTSAYSTELYPGYPWDMLRTPWSGARQVTVSEARRDELAKLMGIPAQDITVVPGGLDMVGFFGLNPQTQALLEHIQLVQAAPILLMPVRLIRRKNLELALETVAVLRHEMPRTALVITGTYSKPDYFEKLKKLRTSLGLDGAVHLVAQHIPDGLPKECLADFYRLADALFLPSSEEGFGFPILEAGLSRLPVFCTDLPALRDLAGHWAFYFSPEDSAKTIARLIIKELRTSSTYRLHVRVRQEYTWQALYLRYLAPLLE